MADMNDLGFDANKVDPNEGFDLLPAADYDMVIVNSEVKPNSKGTGKYLKLEMQIINGKYQNRKVWDQLNLWNPSEEAVKIARGTLSALCRAVNVMTPKDSTELHNKPFRASVKIKKGDAQYGDKNEISSYKARNAGGGQAPAMAGAATGDSSPAASTPNANPWG